MKPCREVGQIARLFGEDLPVEIIEGDLGFYLGTREDGLPFSRESDEYFATREQARRALSTGRWTQRECAYRQAISSAHRSDNAARR